MKTIVNLDDAAMMKLMEIANLKQEKFAEWLNTEYKLSKKKGKQKILTFGDANLSKLEEIVNIKQTDSKGKFNKWFSCKYEILKEEEFYLNNLITKNKLYLSAYNEDQLKAKFIIPVLNKVDFFFDNVKDWYEYPLSAILNNVSLNGKPDFAVATGTDEPKIPYFFLQEYKKSINFTGNPEYQVLAAMLSAMTLNKKNEIKGAYIIGQFWKFIILEKTGTGNYEYFVHEGLNCLKFEDLKQIYINLQAVKFFIRKEINEK